MNVYFSTWVNTDFELMAIGMVADNGETFYAEHDDFSLRKLKEGHFVRYDHKTNGEKSYSLELRGDKDTIIENMNLWFQQFEPDTVQLVGDQAVCQWTPIMHYIETVNTDEVPLNETIFDLNQMIGVAVARNKCNGEIPLNTIMAGAFNWNREEMANTIHEEEEFEEERSILREARMARILYWGMYELYFTNNRNPDRRRGFWRKWDDPSKAVDPNRGDSDA